LRCARPTVRSRGWNAGAGNSLTARREATLAWIRCVPTHGSCGSRSASIGRWEYVRRGNCGGEPAVTRSITHPGRGGLALSAVIAASAWCGDQRSTVGGTPRLSNACGDSAALSWTPSAPREGALFRVRVSGAPAGTELSGAVAGEGLHFPQVPGALQAVESFAAGPRDTKYW
jgi:hypothetical protein